MPTRIRRLVSLYFLLQALGASVWWGVLLLFPETRAYFQAKGSPVPSLLAFVLPDAILFIGTSFLVALGIWKEMAWSYSLLLIHTGAAAYAGLYCWMLVFLTRGDGLLGALLMTPSLVVPGIVSWYYGRIGETGR